MMLVVRARETAVEARPEVCFTVRELDAAVLDEAGLDTLDVAVLDAAALDGLAVCAPVFTATRFEAVVLAAADVRGRRVGAV
jgi:hypothetical protein